MKHFQPAKSRRGINFFGIIKSRLPETENKIENLENKVSFFGEVSLKHQHYCWQYLTIFQECALVMRWQIANKALSTDLAIIISYPTSTKYQEFSQTLKTTDFQLVFKFEQMGTVTILGEHGIMTHIMAKPIRALELQYPMIQFLNRIILQMGSWPWPTSCN